MGYKHVSESQKVPCQTKKVRQSHRHQRLHQVFLFLKYFLKLISSLSFNKNSFLSGSTASSLSNYQYQPRNNPRLNDTYTARKSNTLLKHVAHQIHQPIRIRISKNFVTNLNLKQVVLCFFFIRKMWLQKLINNY